MKYPSYVPQAAVNTTAPAAPAWTQPDFVAGQWYKCDGPLDGTFKSKSFKKGTVYLCVSNNGQRYLVTETAKLVEIENLRSKFLA